MKYYKNNKEILQKKHELVTKNLSEEEIDKKENQKK